MGLLIQSAFIRRILLNLHGIENVASGQMISFLTIAQLIETVKRYRPHLRA
jgi:hypothetical protein